MPTLAEFTKLHSYYTITDVNGKKLCNEEEWLSNHYYIKIQTDKYPDVDWTNECCISILKYDLSDAKVVYINYSGNGAFDLFG